MTVGARLSRSLWLGFRGRGGYQGARSDRASLQEWSPPAGSGNDAVIPDLGELQRRSHDLVRNAPIAAGAVDTQRVSVIGAGLTAQPSVDWAALGLTKDDGQRANIRLRQLWDAWANTTACDLAERFTFGDLQWQAFGMTLLSGDGLVARRWRETPSSAFGLRLQLIEGDRISNPQDALDTPDRMGGVEVDEYGSPRAYHVRDAEGLIGLAPRWRWQRLEVAGTATGLRRLLYLGDPARPGQLRAPPLLSPVIETLKQVSRLTDAELSAAVASSLISLFITNEDPVVPGLPGLDTGDPAANAPPGITQLRLRPASVVELPRGRKIESWNPQRPNPGFDPFFTAMVKQIGISTGLPFELLMMHFSASYSASRAALLEAWRRFERRREWFARHCCQPVYEWFLDEVHARGLLEMPGWDDPLRRRSWSFCVWTGPSRGEIDELRQAKAVETRLRNLITTLEQETAAHNGGDWEANLEQAARERQMIGQLGLDREMLAERIATEPVAPRPAPPGPLPPEPEEPLLGEGDAP